MDESFEKTKAHCNTCLRETNHNVVAKRVQRGEEQLGPFDEGPPRNWIYTYEMLECCGCEDVTLRRTFWHCEAIEDSETYCPPMISRRIPIWRDKLPREICWIFDEVYAALGSGSHCLAVMGARTIIDMVILHKIGDQGTFSQKLDEMQKAGYLSAVNRNYLNAAIDAGNAAAHRGHRPDEKAVSHVIDIVENLVHAVYVLDSAAKSLSKSTPPRPPKLKAGPSPHPLTLSPPAISRLPRRPPF